MVLCLKVSGSIHFINVYLNYNNSFGFSYFIQFTEWTNLKTVIKPRILYATKKSTLR